MEPESHGEHRDHIFYNKPPLSPKTLNHARSIDHLSDELLQLKTKTDMALEFDFDELKLSPTHHSITHNLIDHQQQQQTHIPAPEGVVIDDEEEESNDIDKLEDQFIDHNNGPTTDNSIEPDEFQRSLDERASQLAHDSFQAIPKRPLKPVLDFQYNDYQSLVIELNEWFVNNDLKMLNLRKFGLDCSASLKELRVVLSKSPFNDNAINDLLYLVFGNYNDCNDIPSQLESIVENSKMIFESGLLSIVLRNIGIYSQMERGLDSRESFYLWKNLTIVYFMTNVFLQEPDNAEKEDFIRQLTEFDLLSLLVKFVEEWRWHPKKDMKIRSILLVVWKLILLEMGDSSELMKTKDFLSEKFHVAKNDDPSELFVTPLDYHVFQEDLTSRYPSFYETIKKQRESKPTDDSANYLDNSNSLSNLIDIPRPLKTQLSNNQLPTPTIHLATPAPSPPSTPIGNGNGGVNNGKLKKSFQLNQSYPFIYPIDDPQKISHSDQVPFAIKEANDLISDRIYRKLGDLQLYEMKQDFMKQERGWINNINEDNLIEKYEHDESTIKEFPEYTKQIRALMRVESFYRKNLSKLNSFMFVLVQIIKSNYIEFDLNLPEPLTEIHKLQLEIIATKEVTLKASSSIMNLLLSWFKKSHILKYVYLTTLIFDHNYFEVVLEFIKNQNYNNMDKLLNPTIRIPEFQFFNRCLNVSKKDMEPIKLLNTTNYDSIYNEQVIEDFNWRYCFILYNLLTVMEKVILNNTQRIITLCEKKPSDLIRNLIEKYENQVLYKPILKVLKKIIPYQGRKWKSNNMNLISLIYLQLKLNLKDHWLSGKDIEGELRDSYGQEIAIRAILQYYNVKYYKFEMVNMGYELIKTDFFSREMDNLSNWENQ